MRHSPNDVNRNGTFRWATPAGRRKSDPSHRDKPDNAGLQAGWRRIVPWNVQDCATEGAAHGADELTCRGDKETACRTDKDLGMGNTKKKQVRKSAGPPVVELIVRRGALDRFDKLRQDTRDLPVRLSWDRRLHERRTSPSTVERDHRSEDRRKKPPFSWEVADFVVVEMPAPADSD